MLMVTFCVVTVFVLIVSVIAVSVTFMSRRSRRTTFHVVLNDVIGGVEDDLRGAVVLLELDDFGALVIVFEAKNVGDRGAAPAIDRLVVIADDGEVIVLAGEVREQLVLGGVGVLELVDHQEAPLLAVGARERRIFAKDLEHAHDQIAKVEAVLGLQTFLIVFVEPGVVLVVLGVGVFVRARGVDAAVFAAFDIGGHASNARGVSLLVASLQQVSNQAVLVLVIVDLKAP